MRKRLGEFEADWALLDDMERELVLARCRDIERERDDVVQQSRVEVKRDPHSEKAGELRHTVRRCMAETRHKVGELLAQCRLSPVDGLGFELNDEITHRGVFVQKQ